jgi:hypothetical protein
MLGRLYLDQTGTPQYIIRYTTAGAGQAETTTPHDERLTAASCVSYSRRSISLTIRFVIREGIDQCKRLNMRLMFRVEQTHWWWRASSSDFRYFGVRAA